jgi:integrase
VASIHKKPRVKGPMSYQVRWRVDGQARSKVAHDYAGAKAIKREVELHGDFFGEPEDITGVPTVAQQAERWLEEHTAANDATLRDYRRIIAWHIAPALGHLKVTQLTTAVLRRWAQGLTRHDNGHEGEPLSDKGRANVSAVIFGIIESAIPDHLTTNPWRRVKLPRTDPQKDQEFLTWEDFGILLAEIPEHHRPLVATLGTTGFRWGEAAALTVADLDLSSGLPVFRVSKAVKHRATQTDKPGRPKTDKAVRRVTGPAELVDVLRGLTDRPRGEPLFTAERGGRLRNSTFHTTVWQPAVTRAVEAGLPFRPRIHDLRAAATTWLLDSGQTAWEVADQMGHKNVATTLEIYRRSNPDAGRRAAAIMGEGLRRAIGS